MTTVTLQDRLRAHGVDFYALASYIVSHVTRSRPEHVLRDLAVTFSRALRRGERIDDPTAYLLALAEKYI